MALKIIKKNIIPIVELKDWGDVSNKELELYKNKIKESFIELEDFFKSYIKDDFTYNHRFAYEFIFKLELLDKNLKKTHLLKTGDDLDPKLRENFYFEIFLEIKNKNNLSFVFLDRLVHSDNRLPLNNIRNSLLHSPYIEESLYILKEKILKFKTDRLNYILKSEKTDPNFLIDRFIQNLKKFKEFKRKKIQKDELFIVLSELRESMIWYGLINSRDDNDLSFKNSSINDIDVYKLGKNAISCISTINVLRNNFIHNILNTHHRISEAKEKLRDIKISMFEKNLDIDAIKRELNDFLKEICFIEIKNKRNEKLISNILKTGLLNVEDYDQKTISEIKKLKKKIEQLKNENIGETLESLNVLLSENYDDNIQEVREIINTIKEEDVDDVMYSLYRSIVNRTTEQTKDLQF